MVGKQAFELPLQVQGHYHAPASRASYKQRVQLLMATDNTVHVSFVPNEQTPKQIIFRLSGSAFQKVAQQEHKPKMDNFYSNAVRFERGYSEDNFDDMQLEDQSQRKQKLDSFLNSYQAKQMYQHQLKASVETKDGKQAKAQLQAKATCDDRLKFCRLQMDIQVGTGGGGVGEH